MNELKLPAITDENVQDSAPTVRALIVGRLEALWAQLEGHMGPREEGGRPDPRFVEAGIRVLDRLARLYRLDQPGTRGPEVGAGGDQVAAVARSLEALEQRLRDREV